MLPEIEMETADIVYNGRIYRYGGSEANPEIRTRTDAGGWQKIGNKGKEAVDKQWAFMTENRDRDCAIEKCGCDLVVVTRDDLNADECDCLTPDWIIDHLEMDAKTAWQAIKDGLYNPTELHALLRFDDRPAIRDLINAIVNQEELPLEPKNGLVRQSNPVERSKSDTVSLLNPVAAQINEEYVTYEGLEKQATMSMLKIGLLMEHAKEQLPHGQFKKWAENNLTVHYRHACRFRKLAQVFIEAQHVDQGEMLTLVDPENSKAELGEKLRNLAFEFLGDKTQAELFAEHGIQVRDKTTAQRLPPPKPKPLDPDDTQAHRDATELIFPVMTALQEYIICDRRIVQHFTVAELKTLQGDLIDAKRIVDDLINAG